MTSMKKILSVLVAAAICMSLFAGTVSAQTAATDIYTMATALNKLNILQGSGGDYLLNNKINRAEAAALIIRMLGKENYVKQNAEQLKYTKYADVPATQWYAPYVGYGTQVGIMVGNPDGSFAPKDDISEKAFLKMAICALGYEYNVDFSWSNVYQKAFVLGIVKDAGYADRTMDNTNYLRSGAASAIYYSLNAFKKDTSSKMVFTLVQEGVFTNEAISASGILGVDNKATVIDVITATASNSIEINLNENIQNVNASDILITDSATTGSSLAVQSVAFSQDKIQVITAGQIPGRNYVVRVNSVTDANGYVSGQLTGTFTGYAQQQVASDFFKISKVEQASANVVNVYFTHPVNENSETPAYYNLTKNGGTYLAGSTSNFAVKKLQSVNNAVSIYIKNATLEPGQVYGITASGKLTSSYGVKLGDGYGESRDFVTTAVDSGQLTVSSVHAWTSTSVRVIFSRDVDPGWAEKRLNYTVYDANKTAIAVTNAVIDGTGDSSGRTVMLSLASPLDKTKQYEVKMEYVPDIYKQSSIENKSFSFAGVYPENSGLALEKAVSDYSNCAVLIFNKALDAATAANTSNYIIRGVSDYSFNVVPEKALYQYQYGMYVVKLFLPAGKTFSSSQKYKVYASGLKDSLGSSQLAVYTGEFTGGGNSVVRPQIVDAVTVSKDAVKLMFNIEIAFNLNNISTANYALEYVENGETMKIAPIGVTYVDPLTLVLRFDELDPAKTYLLRFNSITDYSEVYSRTTAEGGNTWTVRQGK